MSHLNFTITTLGHLSLVTLVTLGDLVVPGIRAFELTTSSPGATEHHLDGLIDRDQVVDLRGTLHPSSSGSLTHFPHDLTNGTEHPAGVLGRLALANELDVTVHLEQLGHLSWVELAGLRSTYIDHLALRQRYDSALQLTLAAILDHRYTVDLVGLLTLGPAPAKGV